MCSVDVANINVLREGMAVLGTLRPAVFQQTELESNKIYVKNFDLRNIIPNKLCKSIGNEYLIRYLCVNL